MESKSESKLEIETKIVDVPKPINLTSFWRIIKDDEANASIEKYNEYFKYENPSYY